MGYETYFYRKAHFCKKSHCLGPIILRMPCLENDVSQKKSPPKFATKKNLPTFALAIAKVP